MVSMFFVTWKNLHKSFHFSWKAAFCDVVALFVCVCHKAIFLTSPGYKQWNCRYNLHKLCSAYIMINICSEKLLEYILIVIKILQMMNFKAWIKKQNVRAPDFHFPYAFPISLWQWIATFEPFSTSKALEKGIYVNASEYLGTCICVEIHVKM